MKKKVRNETEIYVALLLDWRNGTFANQQQEKEKERMSKRNGKWNCIHINIWITITV